MTGEPLRGTWGTCGADGRTYVPRDKFNPASALQQNGADGADVSGVTRSRARIRACEYIPSDVPHLPHLPHPGANAPGRWAAALVHQYPLPDMKRALLEHVRAARAMLRAGYYDTHPDKPEEVLSFIADAEAYLGRGGRPR